MHMSAEAFENHAKKLEQEDFEDDVRCLNASLYQLVTARTHTIRRLRESADYLDSIWFRYVKFTSFQNVLLVPSF